MATLTELAEWTAGIYQLETDDPVQGGPDGIDNLQAKQLANRTAYLKALAETLGSEKQPLDATLTALAGLVTAADKLIYATGADAFALATFTAYARTLVAVADAASARGVLSVPSVAEMNAAIAALVASSPAALDTLNELAAALGNDANFATTVTNALALKASIQSVQQATASISNAGGTADAITGIYTPGITAITNGTTLYVRASSANTSTTPSFTPNSGTIAAKTIVKGNGQALVAGDIAGGGHWIELQYDLTLDKWVLLNPSSGITTKGVQRFTSNGSFTVPPGVSTIYISGCAGGGGGGGTAATAASQNCSGGGGGGAGQAIIRQAYSVTPGQVIAITIGAGGSGGVVGGFGGPGGNTGVGTLVTLTGGGGGQIGSPQVGTSPGPAGGSGYPAGGYANDCGSAVGGGSGSGGGSPFGATTPSVRNATGSPFSGINAAGYGSGGSGGGGVNGGVGSAPGATGGNGSPGLVIVEW